MGLDWIEASTAISSKQPCQAAYGSCESLKSEDFFAAKNNGREV